MTVEWEDTELKQVVCVWFDRENERNQHSFAPGALEKVPPKNR